MQPWRRHMWRHVPLTMMVGALILVGVVAIAANRPSVQSTTSIAPGLSQVAGMRLRGAELTSIVNSRPNPGSGVAVWATTVQTQSGEYLDQARETLGKDHEQTRTWESVHDSVLAIARNAYDEAELEVLVSHYLTTVNRLAAALNGVSIGPSITLREHPKETQ